MLFFPLVLCLYPIRKRATLLFLTPKMLLSKFKSMYFSSCIGNGFHFSHISAQGEAGGRERTCPIDYGLGDFGKVIKLSDSQFLPR